MRYKNKSYRTVWMEEKSVKLIDQPKLPFSFKIIDSPDYRSTADHITNMTVRGAPAIGATAAFGMVQAIMEGGVSELEKAEAVLAATRPTAKDLFSGLSHIKKAVHSSDGNNPARTALKAAQKYADSSVEECRLIGKHGHELIADGAHILTHCNAGWLACVDRGTALSPIYSAAEHGKQIFVYVDETRPRGQGARLTAWELENEKIPHAVIADNAAGHYMSINKINIVITGADRIAMNGDAANKIGTLEKAVCAARFNVPFYIAAPFTTFDKTCAAGSDIPIEERNPDEVRFRLGKLDSGEIRNVMVVNPGSDALNPAFDVTPAELIRGYITPAGIITADTIPDYVS